MSIIQSHKRVVVILQKSIHLKVTCIDSWKHMSSKNQNIIYTQRLAGRVHLISIHSNKNTSKYLQLQNQKYNHPFSSCRSGTSWPIQTILVPLNCICSPLLIHWLFSSLSPGGIVCTPVFATDPWFSQHWSNGPVIWWSNVFWWQLILLSIYRDQGSPI